MVNNAGMETRTSTLDTTERQFDLVIAIDLKSAFFGVQLAAKQMIAQGGGGRIINISSIHEDWPMPGNSPYCAAKGGMRMLTRTAGVELAPHGITVVGVAPGRGPHADRRGDARGPGRARQARERDPPGPGRRARRDRQPGRVPRLGRRVVWHGHDVRRRWRDDAGERRPLGAAPEMRGARARANRLRGSAMRMMDPGGTPAGVERERMADAGHLEEGLDTASPWYQWGPYVSERAWGSVREDYSADGDAWASFPHDHARSRAYRWNEDGMAGLSDVFGRLNLGLALWNGKDPILKERMFGLTNGEGNHGEDVKEYWWYLDAVPSSAWLRWRYHYPQAAFPYERADRRERPAVEARAGVRAARHRHLRRRPLLDRRGPLRQGRPDRHPGADHRPQRGPRGGDAPRAARRSGSATSGRTTRRAARPTLEAGARRVADPRRRTPSSATTSSTSGPARTARARAAVLRERDQRAADLRRRPRRRPIPKDGINDHVVRGAATVNPAGTGTKAAAWYRLEVKPGETAEIRLRLRPRAPRSPREAADARDLLGAGFEATMVAREAEADAFYADLAPAGRDRPTRRAIMRQAFAGMLWSKQYYGYDVTRWLDGDPAGPPPAERAADRPQRRLAPLRRRGHPVHARPVGVPVVRGLGPRVPHDHARPHRPGVREVPAARAVPGVVPAPERRAARLRVVVRRRQPAGPRHRRDRRVADRRQPGHASSCERIFHKLLLNFTWWLNRQDAEGNDLFSGGFLGLDNLSAFDRSHLPVAGRLEQSDATAWMFAYCLSMLRMALDAGRA